MLCPSHITLLGGLHSLPATNSDTGPEVELQKEEAPISLRNHCHPAPLAPISLGPRNPQGRWGGSLSYMEHSNEDLGERKQIKEMFVPEQEFGWYLAGAGAEVGGKTCWWLNGPVQKSFLFLPFLLLLFLLVFGGIIYDQIYTCQFNIYSFKLY